MEAGLVAARASIVNNPRASVSACGTYCALSSGMPSVALASSFLGLPLLQGSGFTAALCWKDGGRRAGLPVRAADNAPVKRGVSYASYAVPMENQSTSSFITRPLAEILRDMYKRVPDKVLKMQLDEGVPLKYIPWYHANRMLSFYAPGWSGEVRNITFSTDSKTVSVVYRVTIRGSDGEAWREASGTSVLDDGGDPVQKAEGMAFRRACARFGLGLYLYHEDETA